MRPIAITSASKPSIAINASQRAIRARTTPYMTSPPTSLLPSGRIVQFRPISRGEIGTGMRRCTDKLLTRPRHIRRQHRQAAGAVMVLAGRLTLFDHLVSACFAAAFAMFRVTELNPAFDQDVHKAPRERHADRDAFRWETGRIRATRLITATPACIGKASDGKIRRSLFGSAIVGATFSAR